jgi:galactose mutarotase-like enzyme
MSARIDTHWSYNGLRAAVMENRLLRLTVLPELGGKVYDLVYKPTDTNFLWHHPRVLPRPAIYGTNFDNCWAGGWDEVLPSTEICTYRGEEVPHMGEIWSLPWAFAAEPAEGEEVCLYATVSTPIMPARFERWLRLRADEPVVRAHYRITSLGPGPLDFIWGVHPAFAVTTAHRIDLPPCHGLVGQSSGPALGEAGQSYEWPYLPLADGRQIDMRIVPPFETAVFGGHYAVELTGNWVALTDTARRQGIAVVFAPEVFKAVWMWLMYGGWRGLYGVVLEPWTGYPNVLDQAVAAGRHCSLSANAALEAEVAFVAYTGVDAVTEVKSLGDGYEVR